MHAATNYIYIVFAIIYIIYSIIKAGKKATQQKPLQKKSEGAPTVKPPTSSPFPQPGDDMKKMLEEILGKKNIPDTNPLPTKPQPIPVKPAPKKIIVPEKKVKAVHSHTPSKRKEAPVPFLQKEKQVPPKFFSVEAVKIEEQEIDFDIREAIIYSEILKRPEY